MKKLPVYLTTGLALLFIFSSCKRNDYEMKKETPVFSISQAKEWFANNLQTTAKSRPTNTASRLIDSLPPNNKTLLWKFAIQKKNSEVEAVELPYTGTAVVCELPDSSYANNQQRNAIALGIAKRAVIYKKPNGAIELMLVHIVPSYDYLLTHPNHFKESYFLNLAADFTGWIYTYDWNDNPKSISEIKNGELTGGKTRVIQQAAAGSTNNRWVNSCYNVCSSVWIGTVGANCGNPGDQYYEDCIYNSQASQGGWSLYCRTECGIVWVPDPWTDNPGDTGGGTPPNDCNYYGTCSDENFDNEWNDNIQNNTNNPCIDQVLKVFENMQSSLPNYIRRFFGHNPNFNPTLKMELKNHTYDNQGNIIHAPGGWTTYNNLSLSEINIHFNSLYSNATDLSLAATTLHEFFHAHLINEIRIYQNNSNYIRQLYDSYGYLFSTAFATWLVNNPGVPSGTVQHELIATNYRGLIIDALNSFAAAKGIDISNLPSNYISDLSWAGCLDSDSFKALPGYVQERIKNRLAGERDPYDSAGTNLSNEPHYGDPCN